MRDDIDTMPVITLTGIGQGERRVLRLTSATPGVASVRLRRDVFQRCGNFRIWAVVSTSPKVSSISERAA